MSDRVFRQCPRCNHIAPTSWESVEVYLCTYCNVTFCAKCNHNSRSELSATKTPCCKSIFYNGYVYHGPYSPQVGWRNAAYKVKRIGRVSTPNPKKFTYQCPRCKMEHKAPEGPISGKFRKELLKCRDCKKFFCERCIEEKKENRVNWVGARSSVKWICICVCPHCGGESFRRVFLPCPSASRR